MNRAVWFSHGSDGIAALEAELGCLMANISVTPSVVKQSVDHVKRLVPRAERSREYKPPPTSVNVVPGGCELNLLETVLRPHWTDNGRGRFYETPFSATANRRTDSAAAVAACA